MACSVLPATPTPFVFPTPNLTLTALFNPDQGIPPTATPIVLASPTPLPSPTPPQVIVATPTAAQPTTPPTPAPPPTRPDSNGAAIAPFASSPITIDGDWSEWPKRYNYVFHYVVYGAAEYGGKDDLEGFFRVAWDKTYFYFGARVHDDRYIQPVTGASLYKGDSLEVLLDTQLGADYYTTYLSADDHQYGFSAGDPIGTNPEVYRWYPAGLAGWPNGAKIAARDLGGGFYLVEAAIPWSVIGVTPYTGLIMGFCASLSDNDKANRQAVQQSMLSNCPNRTLTNPTTWGSLVLGAAP